MYQVPYARTNVYKYSFFPATVRMWNTLPLSLTHFHSLQFFKKASMFITNTDHRAWYSAYQGVHFIVRWRWRWYRYQRDGQMVAAAYIARDKKMKIIKNTRNTFCRTRSLSNATFFSFLITWRSSSSKSAAVYNNFMKIGWFLSRVSIQTRDIDIANLSVRTSVRLSVTFRYQMKTA